MKKAVNGPLAAQLRRSPPPQARHSSWPGPAGGVPAGGGGATRRGLTRGSVIVSSMGLPRHLGTGDSSPGYGPFGRKAFKGALLGCVVLVIAGLAMALLGGGASGAVGTSFIALGVLGLATGGAGLLAEHLLQRRPPPPRSMAGNGHSSNPPDPSRIERRPEGRDRPV